MQVHYLVVANWRYDSSKLLNHRYIPWSSHVSRGLFVVCPPRHLFGPHICFVADINCTHAATTLFWFFLALQQLWRQKTPLPLWPRHRLGAAARGLGPSKVSTVKARLMVAAFFLKKFRRWRVCLLILKRVVKHNYTLVKSTTPWLYAFFFGPGNSQPHLMKSGGHTVLHNLPLSLQKIGYSNLTN